MDRRVIKTKDAIVNAYKTLLIDKPNSKITITDLAKEANIDRKTFYLHYASIDEIRIEIMECQLADLELELNQNNILNVPLDASALMQALNNCLMKNFNFYRALAKRSDFDLFRKQTKDFLLEKMIETSSSELSERELTLYYKFLISGIVDVYSDWFCTPSEFTLEELGIYVANIIHNGIFVFAIAGIR